jgi:hypothetical protein
MHTYMNPYTHARSVTHKHTHTQTHSHEAPITGGFGAEVAAAVQEKVSQFRVWGLDYMVEGFRVWGVRARADAFLLFASSTCL